MLKSSCLELMEKMHDEIDRSCSKFRFPFNFTQYLYVDYMLLTDKIYDVSDAHFKYYRMTSFSDDVFLFKHNDIKMICLNDMNPSFEESMEAAKRVKTTLESTMR